MLLLIIIIFISSVLYVIGPLSETDSGKKERLVVSTNTNDFRVHEEIILFLEDVPNNANVSWNSELENLSYYGKTISIVFDQSEQYTISVVAKWDDIIGHGSITLPVKNQDEEKIWGGPGLIEIRISRGKGAGEYVDIYPGISTPTVYSHVTVKNIYGRFSIICVLFYQGESTGETIYEKDISGINRDVDLEIYFYPDDLPKADRQYDVSCGVHCQQGSCGPWEVFISTEY